MSNEEKVTEKFAPLFQPFHIGSVEIKNRFLMGPMGMPWTNDPETGAFTDEAIAFYAERAKGGFGAIVSGVQLVDTKVDPIIRRGPLQNPAEYIRKGKELNKAVNAYGTKMFLELGFGVGRNYPTFKAPSASPAYQYPTIISGVLTRKEIASKRDQIIEAAVDAKEAGYAGIDIHTLHWGYLLDQFVLSITNHRTDEYGGSLENRLRLLRETVDGIHYECGNDYPVIVGLGVKSYIKALNKPSLFGEDEAGRTVEESIEIAKMLEKMGIAAILCDTGLYDSFYYACPPSYMPKGHALGLYQQIKGAVKNIPIIARSRMGDPELDLEALQEGQADAIMLARPSLADAEFPNKVAAGQIEKIRPCIGCNMGCIGRCLETGEHESCAMNPKACFEYAHPEKKSSAPKKIAVVGGGVAGMQACLTAVECGHSAELFEMTDHLGGELNAAGAHKDKVDIHHARDWFIRELEDKHIPVHLNTQFTVGKAMAGGFDLVIMATGASAVMPASIKGINKAMSAVDLLENNRPVGENIIVVGGGMVGCETAVDLAKKGKKVTLVEQMNEVLSSEFVPQQHKGMLKDMIEYYGVKVYADYKLVEVTDDGAVIEVSRKMFKLGSKGIESSMHAGEQIVLKADNVVISVGLRPNVNIAAELEAKGIRVISIGSAKKAGNVLDSTHDAFETVYALD